MCVVMFLVYIDNTDKMMYVIERNERSTNIYKGNRCSRHYL